MSGGFSAPRTEDANSGDCVSDHIANDRIRSPWLYRWRRRLRQPPANNLEQPGSVVMERRLAVVGPGFPVEPSF